MDITLRKDNVVKKVNSEDMAAALEAKGFVRNGAAIDVPVATVDELKQQLVKASEAVFAADEKRGEAEMELKDVREKLEESNKKIAELTRELASTKEQLEVAVKKNTEAAAGKGSGKK